MTDPKLDIVSKFNIKGTVLSVLPFGNGHINDTYKIQIKEAKLPDYILQRKNHLVFKDIKGMLQNIVRVTEHIKKKLEDESVTEINRKVLTHIQTKKGDYFYQDSLGNYWTVFLLISDSTSVEKIEKTEDAFLAGKGFGIFQKQLADLPGDPLNETIVDFHNIEFRYRNFRNALKINYQNRSKNTKTEIETVFALEKEMHTLIWAQKAGKIPSRITHNDTKINNILFDNKGQILCVIDLDTVMPGLVHFDFGDAIRTAACTTAEDETNLDLITLNLDIFEAFSKGFLEETKSILTKNELDLLVHSAKFMTFIMGLRFLTDYLEGDVYYKIKHPEHNIERCRAQFKLVSEISKKEEKMKEIIQQFY